MITKGELKLKIKVREEKVSQLKSAKKSTMKYPKGFNQK